MSLINDALKRASQADRVRSPVMAATMTELEPVSVSRNSSLSMVLAVVAMLVLGLAGWFFWQWWNSRAFHPIHLNLMHSAPAVAYKATPVRAPAAPVPAPTAPTPVVTQAAPAPTVVDDTPAPAVPTQPVYTGFKPWPADLKLTGIFFNRVNPRVVINGNFYVTGDTIQGIVVKAIEKNKVILEWNGRTKELMMDGD
jgi:hypothetical protein